MKNHVGLSFVHGDLCGKLMWTIDVNKLHLVACELHRIYGTIYNTKVFGVIPTITGTCPIAFELYKYLEL